MGHYFTNDDTAHDFGEIKFEHSGRMYRFTTDRGVFSRERIDFGSRVLIDAVIEEQQSADLQTFLIDMGAGYGPLGIVLGSVLGIKPLMVEVNEDAVDLCRKNAEKNGVRSEVLNRQSYDQKHFDVKPGLYVTNPPFRAGKQVVLEIIEDAVDKLENEGIFYMVVQKKQGMPSYKKAVDAAFGNSVSIANKKGYHVLKGIKYSAE